MKKCTITALVIVGFALICCLFFGGCDSTANNLNQMKYFADSVEQAILSYDNKIADVEDTISEIQTVLSDPNLAIPARAEMQAAIEQAVAVKAKFEGAKVVALEQVRAIREKIAELETDGVQPGEDLIAFGHGLTNVGKSLPPPVGPILAILGTVIAGIGEARRRKATRRAKMAEKYEVEANVRAKEDHQNLLVAQNTRREFEKVARGVVASVDEILKNSPATNTVAGMKAILKSKQRELGVREGVKKLLDT